MARHAYVPYGTLVATPFTPLRFLQAGGALNALGNGLALPYLLIYLHQVRGLSLTTAGLALALSSVALVVVTPSLGSVIDAVGPRPTLGVATGLAALAMGGLALVSAPWQAFALTVLLGVGSAAFRPAHLRLLVAVSPTDRVASTFAVQRVMNNIGVGAGGLAGGLIAHTSRPGTYTVLLVLDAATFLAYLAILGLVGPTGHQRGAGPGRGYRDVLRNRPFRLLLVLNTVFVGVGLGMLQDILPAFAKGQLAVSERGIGLCFLVNTAVVACVQIPASRLLGGRSRMLAYRGEALLWVVAWPLVLLAGTRGAPTLFLLCAAAAVIACGECIHGSIEGPLIVDLSRGVDLGRYIALNSAAIQVGWALARGLGGWGLGHHPRAVVLVPAAMALAGAVVAGALDRRLPDRWRRHSAPASAPKDAAPA